jgi:hypothetical protein
MITIILSVLLGLAFILALFIGIARIPQYGDRNHRHGFAKRDESFRFLGFALAFLLGRPRTFGLANIAEGRHPKGRISRFPDVAIPAPAGGGINYLLAKNSATVGNATLAGAGDIPIGVWDGTTTRGTFGNTTMDDLSIPLIIQLFGAVTETQLVSINSNVAEGDLLVPDANGYAKTCPAGAAGINYVFGRALQAGAAGDNIEFDPILPKPGSGFVPIFAGVMAATVAGQADVLAIAGLLNTDIVVVTLNTQHAAETITTAQAAAGQINVALSAAASIGNTKYNVVAYRAVNS